MENSADSYQMALSEVIYYRSLLFSKDYMSGLSRTRINIISLKYL